jgi:hypothetical protein
MKAVRPRRSILRYVSNELTVPWLEPCARGTRTNARAGLTKMEMQQAITAKRTNEPPIEPTSIRASDRLHALGRLLYGEHWVMPMARDLKIQHDTVAKWASETYGLLPDHPIFAALAVLVHYHDNGVAKACKVMDRNRVRRWLANCGAAQVRPRPPRNSRSTE